MILAFSTLSHLLFFHFLLIHQFIFYTFYFIHPLNLILCLCFKMIFQTLSISLYFMIILLGKYLIFISLQILLFLFFYYLNLRYLFDYSFFINFIDFFNQNFLTKSHLIIHSIYFVLEYKMLIIFYFDLLHLDVINKVIVFSLIKCLLIFIDSVYSRFLYIFMLDHFSFPLYFNFIKDPDKLNLIFNHINIYWFNDQFILNHLWKIYSYNHFLFHVCKCFTFLSILIFYYFQI